MFSLVINFRKNIIAYNFIVDLNDPTYVVASQHFRQLFYRYGSPGE